MNFFSLFNRKQTIELPAVDFLVDQKLQALDAVKAINANIDTAIDARHEVIATMNHQVKRLDEARKMC